MIDATDITSIIDSVNYSISGVETLLEQLPFIKENTKDLKNDLDTVESRISILAETKTFYIKAVDLMYEESIGALKETLNTALQYVITDKNYSCNLTLEDKRGTKNLYISIIDNDEGFEVDWKHGVGQGIRAILSFVLKAFYLINQNSRILLLDEKYSTLSDQYVSRFFEFVKKFTEEKKFIIICITHDPRFMDYADKTFLVADGNIHEVIRTNVLEEKK